MTEPPASSGNPDTPDPSQGATPPPGSYPPPASYPPPPGSYPPPPSYPGGYPPPPPQPYAGYAAPAPARNGMGIAALIVGLVSLLGVLCFGFGGFVLGLIAIVLGFVARGRVKRGEADNGGIATAGIALGVLGIVVNAALLMFGVWSFMNFGGQDLMDCLRDAGNDSAAQLECQERFTQDIEDRFGVTLTPTP